MKTRTHNGLTFRIEILPDHDNPAPWEAEDGHGVISGRERREPTSAELILTSDRGLRRYYDVQASRAIALRDSWGASDEWIKRFREQKEREPTKRDIAALAVQEDYERMRAWCNGNWYYAGVIATLLDVDDNTTHVSESVWGIQSDDDAYIENTVTLELMRAITERIGDASTITQTFKVRK